MRPQKTMKTLWVAMPLLLACSSPDKNKEKPKSTPTSAPKKEEAPAQAKLCLAGLSGLKTETPPEERLAAVLTACAPGCRPKDIKEPSEIAKWEKGELQPAEVLAACDVFCSDEAKNSKTKDGATDWREVARVCGGEYYKLPIGQESFLTQEWAAISKISDYTALSLRTLTSEPALLSAVKEALNPYWILMPIPTFVAGQYKLATSTEGAPSQARLFVRMSKGSSYLGAIPMVTISAQGAAPLDIPGLSWPSDVTTSTLPKKVEAGIAQMKNTLAGLSGGAPVSAPSSDPSSASMPAPMMKTAEREDPESIVLYVADEGSPVHWLVDVIDALPNQSVRVAVATDGKTRQHKARLAKYFSGSNTAPTTITITPEACLVGGSSPLPPTSVPAQNGSCDAAALQAEISKAKISGDRLSLVLDPSLSLAQLIAALDVASKLTSLAIFIQISEPPASAPSSAPSSAPTNP